MRKSWMLAATLWVGMATGGTPGVAAESATAKGATAKARPAAVAKSDAPKKSGAASQPKAQPSKAQASKAQPVKAKDQPPKAQAPKAQTAKAQAPKSKVQAPKAQKSTAQPSATQSPTVQAPRAQSPAAQSSSMVRVRVVEPGPSSVAVIHDGQPGKSQEMGQARWQGQVVEVTDGDSMIVMFEDTPRRISLSGIDAPERGQAFGAEATGYLKSLVLGKVVQVQLLGRAPDGESLAKVTVGSNDVGAWMVGDGYAWWHREYAREETALQRLEDEARTARRGLWSEDEPVAPWEFRK